jgi:hypothetical protein
MEELRKSLPPDVEVRDIWIQQRLRQGSLTGLRTR